MDIWDVSSFCVLEILMDELGDITNIITFGNQRVRTVWPGYYDDHKCEEKKNLNKCAADLIFMRDCLYQYHHKQITEESCNKQWLLTQIKQNCSSFPTLIDNIEDILFNSKFKEVPLTSGNWCDVVEFDGSEFEIDSQYISGEGLGLSDDDEESDDDKDNEEYNYEIPENEIQQLQDAYERVKRRRSNARQKK
eukprot:305807_1